MNRALKRQLADLWTSILRTNPEPLFERHKSLLRKRRTDDLIAQPGYVGPYYKPRGLLLVGMNPGGSAKHEMNEGETDSLNALLKLRKSSKRNRVSRFDEMNRVVAGYMEYWGVLDSARRILKTLNVDFSEVAYVNLLKWRTTKERTASFLLRASWENHTRKQIELLAPSRVIALGIATGRQLRMLGGRCDAVVRRQRGDRGSSPEIEQSIRAACRSLRHWAALTR
jgi:hypothetical protein